MIGAAVSYRRRRWRFCVRTGDSNSTAAVAVIAGGEAVGAVSCGFCERLVIARARCCPSFTRRLRIEHGQRARSRLGEWLPAGQR
jgi:hypothetical protein